MPACIHPRLDEHGRCYWCLKLAALNGGRTSLSDRELEFVGVGDGARAPSDGWRSPDTRPAHLSGEHSAMLRALQDVGDPGRARLDFLGG